MIRNLYAFSYCCENISNVEKLEQLFYWTVGTKKNYSEISNKIFNNFLGWYHGERIRDGAQGWFPGNYTEEVASPHVRARNLKQRYRLLTFTAAYYESQKKK